VTELDSCEFRLPESDLDEFHHKATRTLFIGNLDKSVTKDVLRDTFNKFGHIVVSIIYTMSQKNCAFSFLSELRQISTNF